METSLISFEIFACSSRRLVIDMRNGSRKTRLRNFRLRKFRLIGEIAILQPQYLPPTLYTPFHCIRPRAFTYRACPFGVHCLSPIRQNFLRQKFLRRVFLRQTCLRRIFRTRCETIYVIIAVLRCLATMIWRWADSAIIFLRVISLLCCKSKAFESRDPSLEVVHNGKRELVVNSGQVDLQ